MNALEPEELDAWEATIDVIENFLGNKKAPDYEAKVNRMIEAYHVMGVHMSLKIHFLAHHLDFFPDNLGNNITYQKITFNSTKVRFPLLPGNFSDEHGERFHQEVSRIEESYKGKNPSHMLGQYTFSICRDKTGFEERRKTYKKHF